MKKTVTLTLATLLLVGTLSGCAAVMAANGSGAATTSLVDAQPNNTQEAPPAQYSDAMKMPHVVDLSPEDGADSVEREGDHIGSAYFRHPDFYSMTTTDTLTILTGFQTHQQTSEWSCGVDAAMMAINWYGMLGEWNVETLAALRHELTGEMAGYPGTTLRQIMDIFDGVGGFDYITTLDFEDPYEGITLEQLQHWLAEDKPVLVCWNDWGGHWQAIIGYDTMGTETLQDDVIIVADSYDTTDHNQDGYGIYPAERFYYNFTMYDSFTEEEGGNDMLLLVPFPSKASGTDHT